MAAITVPLNKNINAKRGENRRKKKTGDQIQLVAAEQDRYAGVNDAAIILQQ